MTNYQSRITSIGPGGYQQQTLSKRVPTVFIALGGSGKEVVMRLRKRFSDSFQTKDPGFAQFVFIDTDTQAFTPKDEKTDSFAEIQPNQDELVAVPITPAQFHKTFVDLKAKVNCDHLTWLKEEMEKITPQSVEHGAGTYRPMGRLAFYLNFNSIRGTIERKIAAALAFAAANPRTVEENRVEVVITMSLAGGTGAGMFIDVAYLVQEILGDPRYHNLMGRSVTLIAFLPGVFEDQKDILERLQQNAFAAFMELEHYGTPRTGDELFLGDVRNGSRPQQSWTGFTAYWREPRRRFIPGPGWDTCFLIDNRNDLDPNAPLSRREVFQMAADYLFLDFENHEFAIAKRSARCNLVQFKDKIKETWVRRPDNADDNTSIFEGNSVYATQNGCRFSSFGLAEIFFDVEKLYKTASYRLASRLVRQRWIGAADSHPDSQYLAWVRELLVNPQAVADQATPLSFHPDSLTRLLLTSAAVSHLATVERDAAELAKVEPEDGLDRLKQILTKHAGLLHESKKKGENGAARQTLIENLTIYSGDAGTLGPLRKRLEQIASKHCAEYGTATTLAVLERFRDTLEKARNRARALAEAPSASDDQLLARLSEATQVPWPVRNQAISIEFEKARPRVIEALRARYARAAATTIDRLLLEVGRYIGAPGQASFPELAHHGTLHGKYTRAQMILKALTERLEERYEVAFNDEAPKLDDKADTNAKKPGSEDLRPRVSRRHSISPRWDKVVYDRKIDEAIVGHPEIKKAEAAIGGFNFDWKKLEAQVLQQLRGLPRGDMVNITNVDELVEHIRVGGMDTIEGIELIAELIAEACRIVLHGAKDASGINAGGFQLADEGHGNAIDLLIRQPDWADALDKMVKASMPYIQTTDPSRVSFDFSPAYSNLYSQKQGTTVPSPANAARVYREVRDILSSRSQNTGNEAARTLDNPLPSENSTIILVREMTGFPLQFYAHLDTLRDAYEKTITKVGNLGPDVAHINYKEASENLPDINLLESETYALIRDHVTYVIRAMILGTINWREDVLKVSIPDTHTRRSAEIRLGSRLHRAIKYACDKERVRKHLVQHWNEWANRATPRDWACFYASARMSWRQLNPERDIRQGEVSSPMRNCYDSLLHLSTSRLTATEEGQKWFDLLSPHAFEEPSADDLSNHADHGSLADTLIRTCLRRLNPDLPIYQILEERVANLHLPVETSVAS